MLRMDDKPVVVTGCDAGLANKVKCLFCFSGHANDLGPISVY